MTENTTFLTKTSLEVAQAYFNRPLKQIRTFTSHSSIFKVITVVLSNGIGVTLKQRWLCSSTYHIVQENNTTSISKVSSTKCHRACRMRSCQHENPDMELEASQLLTVLAECIQVQLLLCHLQICWIPTVHIPLLHQQCPSDHHTLYHKHCCSRSLLCPLSLRALCHSSVWGHHQCMLYGEKLIPHNY